MYCRLFTLNIGPGNKALIEKATRHLSMVIAKLEGYRGITFFGDDESGEFGALSLWNNKEQAEAVSESVAQDVIQTVAQFGLVKEVPRIHIFEVYNPRPSR